jgi:hypothetical protein
MTGEAAGAGEICAADAELEAPPEALVALVVGAEVLAAGVDDPVHAASIRAPAEIATMVRTARRVRASAGVGTDMVRALLRVGICRDDLPSTTSEKWTDRDEDSRVIRQRCTGHLKLTATKADEMLTLRSNRVRCARLGPPADLTTQSRREVIRR